MKTFPPFLTGLAILILAAATALAGNHKLTYTIDGKYSRFVTVAGIDDAVRPAGNAELVILGDGKVLGKAIQLTGKDKAQTVRVDITGVKVLTIRVGFGADGLDVADHVDLAAARLIKADN